MKKFVSILLIISIIFFTTTKDTIVIPDEAIRFRVIANSNSISDQNIKLKVKENVENRLYQVLKDTNSVENARKILTDSVNIVENEVNTTLKNNGVGYNYSVNLGMNYFPEKEYKGINYKEGEYESLVITLGTGVGNNWWCVLFPPLCLLEAEENETSEVEYKSFVKELIDKYFKN